MHAMQQLYQLWARTRSHRQQAWLHSQAGMIQLLGTWGQLSWPALAALQLGMQMSEMIRVNTRKQGGRRRGTTRKQ